MAVRSREQAGRQRLDAANLSRHAEYEHAGSGTDIARNEVPRLLASSESLLKESENGG